MRINRVVVAPHERGLQYRDRGLEKVLQPGVYWLTDVLGRVHVEVYDITSVELQHAHIDALIDSARALCEQHFHLVELGDFEVGLLHLDGKLQRVLQPGSRQLFWRGPVSVDVHIVDYREMPQLPGALAQQIAGARSNALSRSAAGAVLTVEVVDGQVGLVYIDGVMSETLKPGVYAYWMFNRAIKVEKVDLRVQLMDINGQEILTKDKVSLRVNLSAAYQVTDPVLARAKLADINTYVYREMQFVLRNAIATRTLDALLSDKSVLDSTISTDVRARLVDLGIDVKSVGVKDVILPGDMKDILNQVVAAEKSAQANNIRRREETAATRSLLNTAKLMDQNPVLVRLKELETLEKVTTKVDRITVFGGLDGVLNDMVKIDA